MSETRPQLLKIAVSADCPNPTRSDITAGKHGMIIDEPPDRHGNDEGMLPLQALMASLASCTHVIANKIASELGIVFRDSRIEVTGKLDPSGIAGTGQSFPFPEIDLAVTVETDADDGQLEDLKSQLRWRCPVAATFHAAGAKINETWNVSR